MATRTVRLDDEAEAALDEIRKATGLPISEALKQGLRTLRERVGQDPRRTPYDAYRQLDLGPGGRDRTVDEDAQGRRGRGPA